MRDGSSQKEKAGGKDYSSPRFGTWRSGLLLLLAVVLLFSSGCLLQDVVQWAGKKSAQSETYQLSAQQTALVREIGYPDSFILLFYEEEAVDGSLQTVRQETWDYYSTGESYTFLNGDFDNLDSLDTGELGSLSAMPYVPEQFSAKMSRNDVLVSAGVEDFIEVPLEKEYLDNSSLYYADSLAFGLVDGELRYLEALALVEE